jgi:hypothetical protein
MTTFNRQFTGKEEHFAVCESWSCDQISRCIAATELRNDWLPMPSCLLDCILTICGVDVVVTGSSRAGPPSVDFDPSKLHADSLDSGDTHGDAIL